MSTHQQKKVVKVEIFADIICPWCYIGKKRLSMAFAARPFVKPLYIWRAFLLNPDMTADGMDRQTYINTKFGSASKAIHNRIAAAGLENNIDFNFDKITRTPDSRIVHQVLLSTQHDIELLSEAFYHAYFINGKDIGDPVTVAQIIKKTGSKVDHETVKSNATKRQLENDLYMARQLQLEGVPYFIFAGQYAVTGAHMPEHLIPLIDAATA